MSKSLMPFRRPQAAELARRLSEPRRVIQVVAGPRQAGGFDYSAYLTGTPAQRLSVLPAAQEHIPAQVDGKERLVKAVTDLSKAFALAVPRPEALAIRDEVAFFQAVKAALVKSTLVHARPEEELDHAIRQIVVIEELIRLAKEMREARGRGEHLKLTEEELAFYDALETNDSAVQVLGEPVLCQIAPELAEIVRQNTTIDWTVKESARANLRRLVRRLLRKHNYPIR
jgi:type I restriction enzyme R subunit